MAHIDAGTQTIDAKKTGGDKIDFKMITFSLAGKEYGIDIMSVKEIAKAGRFTYVPNAAPFVRGVYNLRGDIISVIDLRTFFHLPSERKAEDALESLLILRIEEHVFGVIVDAIDKVVGISSQGIQPPHPIFGDINVKYIKGIVENGGKLYIILDVDKIFAPAKAEEEAPRPEADRQVPVAKTTAIVSAAPDRPALTANLGGDDMTSSFMKESLAALKSFHATGVNRIWFDRRYAEWKATKGADLQLREADEAEDFLADFWSPSSGALWEVDYAATIQSVLPDNESKNINVWDPGCGKGYETWSLAVLLRKRYPEARIKVWANDSDLLAISMAPNMVFSEQVPELYVPYLNKGKNGYSFIQQIRDSIFFEFHDVLNASPLPPLDLIVCRDLLSFLAPADQNRLLDDFSDKLKPAGMLVLGANERPGEGWIQAGSGAIAAFRRE
ncbi:MAG: CheR family methyltransferase [Spirochaetota bacterium]